MRFVKSRIENANRQLTNDTKTEMYKNAVGLCLSRVHTNNIFSMASKPENKSRQSLISFQMTCCHGGKEKSSEVVAV